MSTSVASSTTTSTVETIATASVAAVTTTSAGASSSTSIIGLAPDVAKYLEDFTAWYGALRGLGSELGKIGMASDLTKITSADLAAARTAVAAAQELADQLRAIEAPAAVAAVHQKVVSGFDELVAILDKEVQAMADKDQAAANAAMAEGQAATAFTNAMKEWGSLFGATTPAS